MALLENMKTGYCALALFCCVTISFNACKKPYQTNTKEHYTIIKPTHETGRKKAADEKVRSVIATKSEAKKNDCITSIPQRVIDASVLPGAEFKQVDLMGYEKIELPTGDKLLIINWGCTSYNLTFRFETSRFGTDTGKVSQWYSILTQLLYVIEPAINSPVQVQHGINGIHQYLEQDTLPLAYNVPLNLSHDSVYADLVFEQVKILNDTAVCIDATFSVSAM
ncbi:MAG: hypothetical protein JXR41_05415 [Bacteroidales bacterium]|nr:hypothetical protein [Bacteroidales bacterium]MBN2762506.1 hypothetical protein [Bacteroidales bacterium]